MWALHGRLARGWRRRLRTQGVYICILYMYYLQIHQYVTITYI
jgi:hypothetical protein